MKFTKKYIYISYPSSPIGEFRHEFRQLAKRNIGDEQIPFGDHQWSIEAVG